jgi:hypothetical protein
MNIQIEIEINSICIDSIDWNKQINSRQILYTNIIAIFIQLNNNNNNNNNFSWLLFVLCRNRLLIIIYFAFKIIIIIIIIIIMVIKYSPIVAKPPLYTSTNFYGGLHS